MLKKSILNKISKYYTMKNQERREQELEEFKAHQPKEYELFLKSKYKTLDNYKKFMAKYPKLKERKEIIETYNQKIINKQLKEEEQKKLALSELINNLTEEQKTLLSNYKEDDYIFNYRKQHNISFKNIVKNLGEMKI